LGRADLFAEGAPHLLEGEGEAADLVALAAGGDAARELAARHLVGAFLEEPDGPDELLHGEDDDAGADAEEDEEEHDELCQRPVDQRAAAGVAGVEGGDAAELELAVMPDDAEPLEGAGEVQRLKLEVALLRAAHAGERVPRDAWRAVGAATDAVRAPAAGRQ